MSDDADPRGIHAPKCGPSSCGRVSFSDSSMTVVDVDAGELPRGDDVTTGALRRMKCAGTKESTWTSKKSEEDNRCNIVIVEGVRVSRVDLS